VPSRGNASPLQAIRQTRAIERRAIATHCPVREREPLVLDDEFVGDEFLAFIRRRRHPARRAPAAQTRLLLLQMFKKPSDSSDLRRPETQPAADPFPHQGPLRWTGRLFGRPSSRGTVILMIESSASALVRRFTEDIWNGRRRCSSTDRCLTPARTPTTPAGIVMHHTPATGQHCLFVIFPGPFDVMPVET
jgi:hypothetical protein